MNTEGLINQLNLLNTYTKALQSEKNSIQTENIKLHKEIDNLVQTQEKLLNEVSETKEKNQELLRKIAKQIQELERCQRLQKALKSKEKELLVETSQKEKCYLLNKKQQEKIKKIQDQLKESSETMRKAFQQKASFQKNLNKASQEYIEILKTNQAYQNTILNLQNNHAQLKALYDQKQALFTLQKKTQVDLLLKIQAKENIIKNLQSQIIKQVQMKTEENLRLLQLLGEEKKIKEVAIEEKLTLQQKYSLLQKQKTGDQSQLTQKVDEKSKMLQNLSQKYNNLSIQFQQKQLQIQENIKLMTIQKKEIDSLRNVNTLLQKQLKEKVIQISQMKSHLLSINDKKSLHKQEIQELKGKFSDQIKDLKKKYESQITENTESHQREIEELKLKGKQQKQQFIRKEELLRQKIKGLQQQLLALEKQLSSIKYTSILENQTRNTKVSQLSILNKVISQQEKCISQQKTTLEGLNGLLSSKQKQIQSLQANNSMLRKQLLISLANQDSSRKQMLLEKQKSTTVSKKSRASDSNLLQVKRISRNSCQLRKTSTLLSQNIAEPDIRRSTVNKFTYFLETRASESLVEEIVLPSQDSDCEGV